MKSNKPVFVRYELDFGMSTSLSSTIKQIIENENHMKMMDYEDWIEDDFRTDVPSPEFYVTYISLDKDGDLASVELTERSANGLF